MSPIYTFHFLVDGQAIIRKLIKEFNLCPKLCFIQKDPGKCEGIKEGNCFGACEKNELSIEYNERIKKACDSLQGKPSYAIVDKGLNGDDQCYCILVCEGTFYGMGYIPADIQIMNPDSLKNHLTIYKENSFIRNLVNSFAARAPSNKVIYL